MARTDWIAPNNKCRAKNGRDTTVWTIVKWATDDRVVLEANGERKTVTFETVEKGYVEAA